MLSSIFQDILIKIKSKVNIDDNKLISILEYIECKDIGTYVYPEKIEERFSVGIKDISAILAILENGNIVKQVYKLYCPKCREFSSDIYQDINELEENMYCENCEKMLVDDQNPFKYVAVYFKVMRNKNYVYSK